MATITSDDVATTTHQSDHKPTSSHQEQSQEFQEMRNLPNFKQKQAADTRIVHGEDTEIMENNENILHDEYPDSNINKDQEESQILLGYSNVKDQTSVKKHQSNSSLNVTSQTQPFNRPLARKAVSNTMLSFDPQMQLANDRSFSISWRNLEFGYDKSMINSLIDVTLKVESKAEKILKNLSGSVDSNQLIAIVGPSGCGKTTLLQLISGNMPTQKGQLTIKGLDAPRVSFIGQGDLLLRDLTTKETLIFSSRLQNTCSNFDHAQHVEPIIQALGLTECANRSVQNLSGGQLKRVCIAQELLYPTNLLVLDEITSGLDASTSFSIVKQLKKLSSDTRYPMTIIMSIHQPSARLFAVFDKVYVMSQGRCLYEGSTEVSHINNHLSAFGLECPKFNNIADYLIEIASDTNDIKTNEFRRRLFEHHETQHHKQALLTHGNKTDKLDNNHAIEDGFIFSHDATFSNDLLKSGSGHDQDDFKKEWVLYNAIEKARGQRKPSYFRHFVVHFERSSTKLRRSYIFTYMQIITYICLGFQLTTFFGPDIGKLSGCPQLPMSFISYVLSSDQDDESISDEMRRLQENVNFLLVTVMTITFAALEITVISFPMEAKTIKREWRNGRYRVSSYFLGRTIADLPIQLMCVALYSFLTYSQTGQYGLYSWRFVSYFIVLTYCALAAQTVGFLFGALFMDSLPMAVFVAPLSIFPSLLFSGFFARVSQFSPVYEYMSRFSHFRYAFEALLVTLYGFNRCTCDQQTLTTYHANLNSQTNTMKDMFKTMLGVAGCAQASSTSSPIGDSNNNVEDTTGFTGDIDSFVAKDLATTISPFNITMSNQTITTTTERPLKAFEDALVDSVYAHMNSSISESFSSGTGMSSDSSAVDMVMGRFTTKLTRMFNSRSNFGRQMPENCSEFNSYLISEFGLKDRDLIESLIILCIVVICVRMICNIILTMSMRTHIS